MKKMLLMLLTVLSMFFTFQNCSKNKFDLSNNDTPAVSKNDTPSIELFLKTFDFNSISKVEHSLDGAYMAMGSYLSRSEIIFDHKKKRATLSILNRNPSLPPPSNEEFLACPVYVSTQAEYESLKSIFLKMKLEENTNEVLAVDGGVYRLIVETSSPSGTHEFVFAGMAVSTLTTEVIDSNLDLIQWISDITARECQTL